MRKILIFCFSFLPLLLFFAAASYGGQATLCWDPPTTNADGTPLTDLGGYNAYYGTSSGNYSTMIDIYLGECVPCPGESCSRCSEVANPCTVTITNLNEGETYYFALTAYDTSDNESEYSNEVRKTISGTSLTISKTGTGSGTVTSSPAGIDCGSTCTANFNAGTVITLTATAVSGSTFTSWKDGGNYKGSGAYSFSLSASKTIGAGFALNTSLRYLLWSTGRLWFLDSLDNYLGYNDLPLDAGEAPIGFSMDASGGTLATYNAGARTTRFQQLGTDYEPTGYEKSYVSNWIGKSHALNKLLWSSATIVGSTRLWTSMNTGYGVTGYRDYTLDGMPMSYCNTGGGTGAFVISGNIIQHLDASGNFSASNSWKEGKWVLKNCAASRLLWYYPATYLTWICTTNAGDGCVSHKEYKASSESSIPVQYIIFGE